MKIIVNFMNNTECFRRFVIFCFLFTLLVPSVYSAARKENINTVTAEGGEIWQNDYNVAGQKKGKYNVIIQGRDRAGNEQVSGPFNVKIDPNSGRPVVRVVYPNNDSIIRQSINILGVASGRYGVTKVLFRLDNGEYIEANGTEYWNKPLDFAEVSNGKHTLYVKALDEKEVEGPEQRIDFILDTSAPVIELTSHKIGDIISGSAVIKGEAGDPNGIKSFEYSDDGIVFRPLSGRRRQNTFSFSLPVRTRQSEDGSLVFYLRAVDTTGAVTTRPFLFFVSNNGPQLELYTPAQNEDVYGAFFLSGRAYSKIGIAELYYEYNRSKQPIEIRPGDPYWSVSLDVVSGAGRNIKITAVDTIGNRTSVTSRLEDRRETKKPVLVIDYPMEDVLMAMPPDMAIYGHIEPGIEAKSVVINGIGELEAGSAFRIGPELIPAMLRKTQTLKLTPVAADSTRGAAVRVRLVKQETSMQNVSQVTVSVPAKNTWITSPVLQLSGSSSGEQLEYRLSPYDDWRAIPLDSRGNFDAAIDVSNILGGPVHMELRTGAAYLPVYHPINVAVSPPEVTFITPPEASSLIHGNKTIIGTVNSAAPVQTVEYSLDGINFTEIPFVSRGGKAWFSYFCNFTELAASGGELAFRVIVSGGGAFISSPEYEINPAPPVPTVIVNTPTDGEVITSAFDISGIAFDDVGIQSVSWRILGPNLNTLSQGPSGRIARSAAEAYAANPNVPFQQVLTDQKFSVPIDFSMITDGEYKVEIFASDPYGVRSEVVSRVIKISTAQPETRVMSPVITRYNNKAILMQGFSGDANSVVSVRVSMDNANTWQNVVPDEMGNWELPLNTIDYSDGIYSALIHSIDRYAIESFSNAMVNIDNVLPELYLSSPENAQRVGTNLYLAGRVSDNIAMKSLTFQIISAQNPEHQFTYDLQPQLVIFETMSLEGFPQGEYIVRIVAKDLADNESIVSRKIVYDADDRDAQIALFNPLPGEIHTGAVHVTGTVTGSVLPAQVQLMLNGRPLALVDVDRYGIFSYEIPESMLSDKEPSKLSASYNSETGNLVTSLNHTVYYSPYGPTLTIESHKDGDVITQRPWLRGRAFMALNDESTEIPAEDLDPSYEERVNYSVEYVEVSYDNGRTFKLARGTNTWRFRLETGTLPPGPQPVVVRAVFGNGEEAVRRLLLNVDTTVPQVATISPPENSVHRDNILVYGTADDNFELSNVDISLRPRSKFWYSVPGPLKGLYFDVKTLGATYYDVGLGLSLFNDNVRFQAQYGQAPADGVPDGGRFTGNVFGIKLLANIFYLPFDFLFGPDWAFYSMNIAVGANFSWFGMENSNRSSLFMGAIVGQWDIANVNLSFFKPKWKYFRKYALYMEPELWFASSDVQAETILRVTIGLRINWF